MLSYFPARNVEEPATKERLDLLRAELRAEIAELRGELLVEMAGLRSDMEQRFNRMTFWLAGSVFSAAGLVIAAGRLGG
jgi:hypothetical protein